MNCSTYIFTSLKLVSSILLLVFTFNSSSFADSKSCGTRCISAGTKIFLYCMAPTSIGQLIVTDVCECKGCSQLCPSHDQTTCCLRFGKKASLCTKCVLCPCAAINLCCAATTGGICYVGGSLIEECEGDPKTPEVRPPPAVQRMTLEECPDCEFSANEDSNSESSTNGGSDSARKPGWTFYTESQLRRRLRPSQIYPIN